MDTIIDKEFDNGDFHSAVKSVATYLEEYSKENFVSTRTIYYLYKILDDKEKRLEWMLKMYEARDPNLPYLAIRNSNPIQKDPTYEFIMKEIGLWK